MIITKGFSVLISGDVIFNKKQGFTSNLAINQLSKACKGQYYYVFIANYAQSENSDQII